MSTVLVIEDQFLVSYELECLLEEHGYEVRHVATQRDALNSFQALSRDRKLAAVVCDNRLISGVPAASSLYHVIRARNEFTPFIVYSGYPPEGMPEEDPYLKIVRKPFADEVVAHLRALAPPPGKRRDCRALPRTREAA